MVHSLKKAFLFFSWFLVSLVLVALGKPLFIGYLAPAAAALGFAFFWESISYVQNKKNYFLSALVWFFFISALELSWMSSTTWVGPLIFIVYLGLALALGFEFAWLSLFLYQKKTLLLKEIFALAGLWTILEWSRLFFLSGFTFNLVGSALTYSHFSMQIAAVLGVYGLSFWVVLVNLFGYRAFFLRTKPSAFLAWAFLAIFPYFFGYIHETYQQKFFQNNKTLSVLLVQTALTPAEKEPTQGYLQDFIRPEFQWGRILSLVKKHKAKESPDLIVLPEVAVPFSAFESFYFLDDVVAVWEKLAGLKNKEFFLPLLKTPLAKKVTFQDKTYWKVSNAFWAQALSNYLEAGLVIGLGDKGANDLNYNAAFHFQPFAKKIERYAKRVLVPIVEYFPFQWCAKLAAEYGISGAFTPGEKARVFQGRLPMGVSICYEETYGHLMRQSRRKGAELFINISNDGWFPNSLLPQAHFELGRVRAVENGMPLIRSCNTGVTAAVDSFGRTIGVFALGPKAEKRFGSLFLKVPLNHYSTLYTFWGDSFIVGLSFFVLALHLVLVGKKTLLKKPELG